VAFDLPSKIGDQKPRGGGEKKGEGGRSNSIEDMEAGGKFQKRSEKNGPAIRLPEGRKRERGRKGSRANLSDTFRKRN